MPETAPNTFESLLGSGPDWEERLAKVVQIVRELSSIEDPRQLVRTFGEHIGKLLPRDRSMTLSRRGVAPPKFLVTRFSGWKNAADPWSERNKLPLLEGGILGELFFCNEPRVINDLEVSPDDPAYSYLEGMRSVLTMPQYDHGEAMTLTMNLRAEPYAFNPEYLAEYIWTANLFGRSVHSLRLSDELEKANAALDQELGTVSKIQRSLLPAELPAIPGVELATYYETAQRAGGDYYDFFPLGETRWGILIADVCGHGADAAVLMAITHAIAHTCPDCPDKPRDLLNYINQNLFRNYTQYSKAFVTAFYGVYDSETRRFTYASAGHDSPRILRGESGDVVELETGVNLPLGVSGGERYKQNEHVFARGDTAVFYTDGITEARRPELGQFGEKRIDEILRTARGTAKELVEAIVAGLFEFMQGRPSDDDRTLLAMKIV